MREITWRPRIVADVGGILTYILLEYKSQNTIRFSAGVILQTVEHVTEMTEPGRPFADDDLAQPYRRALREKVLDPLFVRRGNVRSVARVPRLSKPRHIRIRDTR